MKWFLDSAGKMASSAPILECMSTRKLCYLAAGLSTVWVGCVLAGAFISPKPNNAIQIIGTKCVDDKADLNGDEWFYPRGEGKCDIIQDFDSEETQARGLTADNIVFAFQMPHMRERADMGFRYFCTI